MTYTPRHTTGSAVINLHITCNLADFRRLLLIFLDFSFDFDTMDAVILLKTMHTRIATCGMALVHGSVHTSVPSVSGLGQMHLKNDVHCAPMQGRLTRHSVDCHSLWMIYKHIHPIVLTYRVTWSALLTGQPARNVILTLVSSHVTPNT